MGNRQDGAEVTKMPKIVTSGLALMKCIAFTNAVYSPYNVYQDLKKYVPDPRPLDVTNAIWMERKTRNGNTCRWHNCYYSS